VKIGAVSHNLRMGVNEFIAEISILSARFG
jgi:hypothetical protein